MRVETHVIVTPFSFAPWMWGLRSMAEKIELSVLGYRLSNGRWHAYITNEALKDFRPRYVTTTELMSTIRHATQANEA